MLKVDLTEGHILKKVLLVAIPAILGSLLQMTYNLTDMFWISRVTSIGIDNTRALAAVGTAGYYMWLGYGLILLTTIGLDAFVPQAAGRNDEVALSKYVSNGLVLTVIVAFLYGMLGYLFRNQFIGVFKVDDPLVVTYAVEYLSVVSLFIYFHFLNPAFSSVFQGLGRSTVPFLVNGIGIALNLVIDPLFILTFGLGVRGAAIATILSQLVVTLVFIKLFLGDKTPAKFSFKRINFRVMKHFIEISIPMAVQSILFTLISMYIGIMVAQFGAAALATQRIGTQVESLAWMVAGGFRIAIAAFVGQNIGAKKPERIKEGYFKILRPVVLYGILINALLYLFAEEIYMIFNPSSSVLSLGVDYLRILSISQVFMVLEIATQGAFNGAGKNMPPSIISMVFNLMRIPAAMLLIPLVGINGIWWAISISSVFKGGLLVYWWIKKMNNTKLVMV